MEREVGKVYMVSDGELVLALEVLPEDEPRLFGVTSPLEPELVTEANTIQEAFAMAKDALTALRESRVKYARQIAELAAVNAEG